MYDKIKRNSFKIICIVAFVGVILMGLTYTFTVIVRHQASNDKIAVSVRSDMHEYALKDNEEIQQTFQQEQEIKGFAVNLYVENEETNTADVSIELQDTKNNSVIQEWSLSPEEYIDGLNDFALEDALQKDCSGNYRISITFQNQTAKSIVGIRKTVDNRYNKGDLSIDNNSDAGELGFVVYSGTNTFLYAMFVVLALILIAGGGITYYLLRLRKARIENILVFLVLFLGISHMCLMPSYSTPDERAHFATAYAYSSELMGQEATDKDGNVLVRNEDLLLNVENIIPNLSTYSLITDHALKGSEDNTMVSYGKPSLEGPFWGYAPQIVGITIARVLNLGNISLLALSSLLALIFYTICIYFAVKKIPFGKITIMVIALFPMALETASSFSYDVVVNGLSILYISYVLYLAYEKKGATNKQWLLLLLLIIVMAPIKIVYALIAPLCLIIPNKSEKGVNVRAIAVALSGLVMCFVIRANAMPRVTGDVVTNAVTFSGVKETYTIPYILSHISSVIGILYNTLRSMTDAILEPLFGQRLGFWDIEIPFYICFGFVLLFLMSIVVQRGENQYVESWHKALMILLCTGMIGGITLAMMMDFTSVTDDVVRGIQGRYFTPFLPMIAFCIRNDKIEYSKNMDTFLVMSIYMLNYFTLWRIFETIIVR